MNTDWRPHSRLLAYSILSLRQSTHQHLLDLTSARIDVSIFVAAPPARCFDLARSVEFHVFSTASTGERASAGRTSGLMRLDEEVTRRALTWAVGAPSPPVASGPRDSSM